MYGQQNDNLILNNNQMMPNQGMMNMNQPITSQGMMNQGMSSDMLNQPMTSQGMMNQGMTSQGMMNQPMTSQGMMNQPMTSQGMMNQGMMNQGMMNQGMMNQGMAPQTMQNNQMMMQQPVGGMPQMVPVAYDYGGIEANYCEDPLTILSNVNRAYIFQELEVWEQVTGCEQKNNYNVCVVDPITQMQYYLFRCKEDSSFCQRCCCSGASRAFSMRCKHIAAENAFGEGYNNYFAELLRPFKCTCCCLARPEVSCSLKEGNINLGTIKEPCTCCSPVLEIYGPGELGAKDVSLRYTILIDCCQASYMCSSCKCGMCQELECNIYDGKDTGMNRKVGRIIKKVTMEEFFSKSNTFAIDFPDEATPLDRLLMIFAGLFIDYRLFEDDVKKPEEEDNNNNKNDEGGCCDCDCDFGGSGGTTTSRTYSTTRSTSKTKRTKKSTSSSAKKVNVKKAVKKTVKKLPKK